MAEVPCSTWLQSAYSTNYLASQVNDAKALLYPRRPSQINCSRRWRSGPLAESGKSALPLNKGFVRIICTGGGKAVGEIAKARGLCSRAAIRSLWWLLLGRPKMRLVSYATSKRCTLACLLPVSRTASASGEPVS